MKSHKKGFTLATTLLIMVFVFAVSAVMVAVPLLSAVIKPVLLTVATFESLDFHVRTAYFGSALAGAIVAFTWAV